MLAQPTSVPIKKEVQKALEDARNNVSILEAETARLERLIASQKRELISQEAAKKDMEINLEALSKKTTEAQKQIESERASAEFLIGEAQKKHAEVLERERELVKQETDIKARLKELKDAEDDLQKRVNLFSREKETHFQEQKAHKEKMHQIKSAIEGL